MNAPPQFSLRTLLIVLSLPPLAAALFALAGPQIAGLMLWAVALWGVLAFVLQRPQPREYAGLTAGSGGLLGGVAVAPAVLMLWQFDAALLALLVLLVGTGQGALIGAGIAGCIAGRTRCGLLAFVLGGISSYCFYTHFHL